MTEYKVIIKDPDGSKSIISCVVTSYGVVASEKITENPKVD
jgi:hypothetical protein